ncbi:MAG: ABC transporter ATP-binding protein [Bacillota bacterium]
MSIIVDVKNIYKNFDLGQEVVKVLKDITFQINKGEFVSLMGPSGSGKSTLLYLIGGLDKPTKGKVLFNEKELSLLDDKQESIMRRREIGFVFQFYNLVPNLTVSENVLLPILLDGKSAKKYDDKLNNILDLVGLSDRKNHRPNELSGGQQQRVAIARALINEPDLILADEPTGNLDSVTGREIMELFQKINKEKNKTIVQVTHSKKAAKFGSRIINLKDGRLI